MVSNSTPMAPPCRLKPKAGRATRLRQPQISPANAATAIAARRNSIGNRTQPSSSAYFNAAATPKNNTSMPSLTGTLPSNSQRFSVAPSRSPNEGSRGARGIACGLSLRRLAGVVLARAAAACGAAAGVAAGVDATAAGVAAESGVGGAVAVATDGVAAGAGVNAAVVVDGVGDAAVAAWFAPGGLAAVAGAMARTAVCSGRATNSSSTICTRVRSADRRAPCHPIRAPATRPRKVSSMPPATAPRNAPNNAMTQCM
jgi:hypothetical protein